MDLNVLDVLVFATIILAIWNLRLFWEMRKLYIYSWNVPGPFCLPIIGPAYKLVGRFDDAINYVVDQIGQYPPIVKFWVGSHLLYSLRDPEHVRKVLSSPKNLEKAFLYDIFAIHIGTGLVTAPVPKWKKHRKLIRPSFNQKVLDSFVEVFVEQATIFIKVLQEHTGQKDMKINCYVNAMMMDVIGETAMGLKLNTQGGNTELSENFDSFVEVVTHRMVKVWYHIEWLWKLSSLREKLNKRAAVVMGTIEEVIKKKKQVLDQKETHRRDLPVAHNEKGGDTKREAFLDLILENPDFSDEELKDEVTIFILAGMETTAMTTCYCFEMLGMHPEIQLKVYEEIIEVVGEERPVEFSDLHKLKCLERVLKETLRLFPAALFFLRTLGEDLDLGHHVIPEGAIIVFSLLNIHRDPEHWPDPLKFDPDRFLPEEVVNRPPCAYIPFSYGPRNCIGNTYAMMSLKTVVATTIRKYRVFSGYKSVEEITMKTSFMSRPKLGFKVHVEKR